MAKAGLIEAHKAVITAAVEQKLATLDTAKAAFEDAKALYAAGDDKAAQGDEMADIGAKALYNCQLEGSVTKEETSALMGQIFGYKAKPDGTPSKTPAGQGEVIRKRIVRAVDAANYLNGNGDCPKFLEGVELGDAASVIGQFEAGHISIFTAYDKLGKLKEKATLHPAYNPAMLAKIAAELLKPEAAKAIAKSPELLGAYTALAIAMDTLQAPEQAAA